MIPQRIIKIPRRILGIYDRRTARTRIGYQPGNTGTARAPDDGLGIFETARSHLLRCVHLALEPEHGPHRIRGDYAGHRLCLRDGKVGTGVRCGKTQLFRFIEPVI